tara:strand:- start:2065 stop:2196 length:132 start_codon:yes stop_codon:yes gene_type:complete
MVAATGNFFGYLILFLFVLGWMDFGQGPEYTWWGLIYLLAHIL